MHSASAKRLWPPAKIRVTTLPFQRFLDQLIKHRHQITGVLFQVPAYAPHIGAGVDQLDHVQ